MNQRDKFVLLGVNSSDDDNSDDERLVTYPSPLGVTIDTTDTTTTPQQSLSQTTNSGLIVLPQTTAKSVTDRMISNAGPSGRLLQPGASTSRSGLNVLPQTTVVQTPATLSATSTGSVSNPSSASTSAATTASSSRSQVDNPASTSAATFGSSSRSQVDNPASTSATTSASSSRSQDDNPDDWDILGWGKKMMKYPRRGRKIKRKEKKREKREEKRKNEKKKRKERKKGRKQGGEINDFLGKYIPLPDDELKCPVCLESYSSNVVPVIMHKCGHTICKKCSSCIQDNPNPECPVCRKKYSKKHLKNAPKNFALIQAIGKQQHVEMKRNLCNQHKSSTQHWCKNCQQFVCVTCILDSHPPKYHHIVTVDSITDENKADMVSCGKRALDEISFSKRKLTENLRKLNENSNKINNIIQDVQNVQDINESFVKKALLNSTVDQTMKFCKEIGNPTNNHIED